jgi:hypothetical protein
MSAHATPNKVFRGDFGSAVERAVKNMIRTAIESPEGGLMIHGAPLGQCTTSAKYLARMLGGIVVGYSTSKNPEAEVGRDLDGHDFVLIGDYLIDWWSHVAHGNPLILSRRSNSIRVRRLYGDPSTWEVVCTTFRRRIASS